MVKRLMKLWQLYSQVNNTNIDSSIFEDWEKFLNDTKKFIHDFDFVKAGTISTPYTKFGDIFQILSELLLEIQWS